MKILVRSAALAAFALGVCAEPPDANAQDPLDLTPSAQPALENTAAQSDNETPIVVGRTISGALGAGDQVREGKYYDAYRFAGTAGQSVIIDMTGWDTFLTLFDARDMTNAVASDDDGGEGNEAQIVYTFPADGDYIVYATSAYAGALGDYEISLGGEIVTGVIAEADYRALSPNQVVSGALGAGDPVRDGKFYDAYRFTGTAGQYVLVQMTPESDLIDTSLSFFDANDTANAIATEEGRGEFDLSSEIFIALPNDGEFVVLATSARQGANGPYEIFLDDSPNDTAAPAGSSATNSVAPENTGLGADPFKDIPAYSKVFMGDAYTSAVGPGDLVFDGKYAGIYYFTGEAGQSVTIDMTSDSVDSYLHLLFHNDSNLDDVIASDDDGGEGTNAKLTFELPQTGYYTILATTAFEDETGSYEVRFNHAPIAAGDANVEGIDFGDDSSEWANDDECDDPRFEGSAMAIGLNDTNIRADATDCLNAYRAGNVQLK
jgi:hypothetical protein